MSIPDQHQRDLALDPAQSFIVQAPAGSGKTELLVQRFLVLLANAKHPEEIIAITFTRKAAAEMLQRILRALQNATTYSASLNTYEAKTWQLANKVLQQDKTLGWNLLNNPHRLKILTIDALCSSLAKQMPILAQFSTNAQIIEDPFELYEQAASAVLAGLETEQTWANDLQCLLSHLDNNHKIAKDLFVSMLARRDQWLPHITAINNPAKIRQQLENTLQKIFLANVNSCYQLFPRELLAELLPLINFAADNLKIAISDNSNELPFPDLNHRSHWFNIAQLLLTKEFQWRKSVDKRNGFPATNKFEKEIKQKMHASLEKLSSYEIFRQSLENLLQTPYLIYPELQWQMLESLINLLPILAAQLILTFQEQAQFDFIGVSVAAMQALGTHESPTDLALILDYQIQHILIDEFQDTSATQFKLLELLTAGWQSHDGKTLFLVGDPMQSIYRFRQAEVGLFLQAKKQGIGNIKLQSLKLTVNFRAQPTIIHWLNQTFATLFPAADNFATGAIQFHPADSPTAANLEDTQAIQIHSFINNSEIVQAQKIVEVIIHIRNSNPKEKIAILVRSRTHLLTIIPLLKNAGLKFQGIEIDKLSDCPVVQDLFALTRALNHLSDRIAWLAILRAPWAGLTLADLHVIAKENFSAPLLQTLMQPHILKKLSLDGQQRLQRILPILISAIQNRQRQTLTIWIEDTWQALGGPACLDNEIELEYAQIYFRLLEENNPNETDICARIEKKLENLYIPPDCADDSLQIMTIHKAKGLEFDTVILPFLEKKPMHDEKQLLMWLNRSYGSKQNNILLACIKSSLLKEEDMLYKYLQLQEMKKQNNEILRLLYVAVTRAKKSIHLLGNVVITSDAEIKSPSTGSFLHLLWSQFKDQFLDANKFNNKILDQRNNSALTLKRLSTNWQTPAKPILNIQTPQLSSYQTKDLPDITAQVTGNVIHYLLKIISQQDLTSWNIDKIKNYRPFIKKWFIQSGVNQNLEELIQLVECALVRTLNDPRGQWILKNHLEAKSEFSVTLFIDDKITHKVIDRTFIDSTGTRWIIDYKTSMPQNIDPEIFLDQQLSLYQQQLTYYAIAFFHMEKNPIRLGLYFPLFSGWREWAFDAYSKEEIYLEKST